MAKQIDHINQNINDFVTRQKIFFVGTAGVDGRVNVSPKGMDTLRIVDKNHVLWLNLTGSGNETAAHLLEQNRMTLMFCAFEAEPLIVRFYGTAKVIYPRDEEWPRSINFFPAIAGARQIFNMCVELVQTSCGMAVPFFEFVSERDQLAKWAERKGEQGIAQYWDDRNRVSIDGKPTGIK